jgi:hypothetical protein
VHLFSNGTLISLTLSGCMVGNVVFLQANDHGDCEKRIRRDERNFDKEVREHGMHSRQAEKKWHELEEAGIHCRGFDHGHDHY